MSYNENNNIHNNPYNRKDYMRRTLSAELSLEQEQMKNYLKEKGFHLPTLMRNLLEKLYWEEKNKESVSQST